MKVYAFYHCLCINDWLEITNFFFCSLMQPDVLSRFDGIFICTLMDCPRYPDVLKHLKISCKKVKHISIGNRMEDFEFTTLRMIHEKSKSEDFKVLYFHTKGVTWTMESFEKNPDQYFLRFHKADALHDHFLKFSSKFDFFSLRRIKKYLHNKLRHFLIEGSEEYIELLDTYDVVGLESLENCFLRNFWWSKSTYIRTLDFPQNTSDRMVAENWIMSRCKKIKSTHTQQPTRYSILM